MATSRRAQDKVKVDNVMETGRGVLDPHRGSPFRDPGNCDNDYPRTGTTRTEIPATTMHQTNRRPSCKTPAAQGRPFFQRRPIGGPFPWRLHERSSAVLTAADLTFSTPFRNRALRCCKRPINQP